MDYRHIAVHRITWSAKKAIYGAGKLLVQTPPARYLSVASPKFGPGCRDVELSGLSPGFQQFLRDMEASAAESLADELAGLTHFEAVTWDGRLRLSAFDADTVWFDRDGAVVEHGAPLEPRQGVCACLLRVTGVWTSARSWGLKMAVLEIKELDPAKASDTSSWAFR
jgi:autotransporter translocation and assembly factor TamB